MYNEYILKVQEIMYFVTEVCVWRGGGAIFDKSRWQIYFDTLSGLDQGD